MSAARVQTGDRLSLRIVDLNHDGQGIGRLGRLAVFIDGALPGDLIQAQITQVKTNFAVASIISILEPSPDRVQPPCPLAGICGGCTLQHARYAAQLTYKRQLVVSALSRIGGIADAETLVRPVIGMDHPWQYRAKIQLPIGGTPQKPEIGYYATGSHRIVDAAGCSVQPPVADAIRSAVRAWITAHALEPYQEQTHQGLLRHLIIRIGFATGDLMVGLVINGTTLPRQSELVSDLQNRLNHAIAAHPGYQQRSLFLNQNTRPTNVILGPTTHILAGQGWIEEVILGIRYRISPTAFFQVNPPQTEKLYSEIRRVANPATLAAGTICDLYCGAGAITLQLADALLQKGSRDVCLIGIESNPAAVRDAKVNVSVNLELASSGLSILFKQGDAADLQLSEQDSSPQLVVVDPPRKGCEPRLLETLLHVQPEKLIYVSCNPATLARDLAVLGAGYRIESVQPVDLFPHTGHVETVVLMTRAEAGKA